MWLAAVGFNALFTAVGRLPGHQGQHDFHGVKHNNGPYNVAGYHGRKAFECGVAGVMKPEPKVVQAAADTTKRNTAHY